MMRFLATFFFAVIAGAMVASVASAQTSNAQDLARAQLPRVIVGVLHELLEADQKTYRPSIRPAFFYSDGAWRAFDANCARSSCFIGKSQWTIGFDGRRLGELRTHPPAVDWRTLSENGAQAIVEGTPPWVGARDTRFAGWEGAPVHRPLIATINAAIHDPELWRRAPLNAAALRAVQQAFRSHYPDVRVCRSGVDSPNTFSPWAYRASDILAPDSFSSAAGWRIVSLNLPFERISHCDGVTFGPGDTKSPWAPNLFAIDPKGAVQWLGVGLRLIDAGDWNGDGASELLFHASRYNRDGYWLFANAFQTVLAIEWGYH